MASTMSLSGASVMVITFDEPKAGLQHGSVLSGLFSAQGTLYPGVTLSVTNPNKRHDVGAIYDTNTRNGADPDLEYPFPAGNLAGKSLGNSWIIAENIRDRNGDKILDSPDDEARGGTFTIEFSSNEIQVISFALIDALDSGNRLQTVLTDSAKNSITLDRVDLQSLSSGLVYGSNTANQTGDLSAAKFQLKNIKRVDITTNDSLAIDNVTYAIPEPRTYGLLLLAGITAWVTRWGRNRLHKDQKTL